MRRRLSRAAQGTERTPVPEDAGGADGAACGRDRDGTHAVGTTYSDHQGQADPAERVQHLRALKVDQDMMSLEKRSTQYGQKRDLPPSMSALWPRIPAWNSSRPGR